MKVFITSSSLLLFFPPSFPGIESSKLESPVLCGSWACHGQAAHLPPSLENSNISSQRNDTAGEELHNWASLERHISRKGHAFYINWLNLTCSSVHYILGGALHIWLYQVMTVWFMDVCICQWFMCFEQYKTSNCSIPTSHVLISGSRGIHNFNTM